MPQSSIAYAVGRIRSLAKQPLAGVQLERLLGASDYQEARHILSDMGWADIDVQGVEAASVALMERTCRLIRSLSTDPQLTDSFFIRHDAQNLKSLYKARILETQPEGLSSCGTIPVADLVHAVSERVYSKLPDAFKKAMNELEKQTALKANPMLIDVRIDQALYQEIFDRLKDHPSEVAREYFQVKADVVNALTFLRLRDINQPGLRLANLLVPGGLISPGMWRRIEENPERLPKQFGRYGHKLHNAFVKAMTDQRALPALEKAADDYLLSLFRAYRNEPFAVEVLLGHLLALERETAAVRLILAGKLNGFEPELIRERLREAYVQ